MKMTLERVFTECIVKDFDLQLFMEEVDFVTNEDFFLQTIWTQCQLINNIMSMLEELREEKIFGEIQISQFEKALFYRSQYISHLQRYVEIRYSGVALNQMLEPYVLNQVLHDKAVIGLLALILDKRLFIMDDMEFMGKKQSLNSSFLT